MTFRECVISRIAPIVEEFGWNDAIDWLGSGDLDALDDGERDPLVVEDCIAGYHYVLGAAEYGDVTILELIDDSGITGKDFS